MEEKSRAGPKKRGTGKVVFNQAPFLRPSVLIPLFWAYTAASPNALSPAFPSSLSSISSYLPIT